MHQAMHSSRELESSSFEITVDGRELAELRATSGGDRARADEIAARLGEVAPDERARIKRARKELVDGDVPVETYRRIGLDEALGLLAPKSAETTRRPLAATR